MKIGLAISAAFAIAAHSEIFTLTLIVAWLIIGTFKLGKELNK